MWIRKPSFYDDFHCIAAQCPDSCCKEWDVAVDGEKAALYRSLPGELGDRLRLFLQEDEGETYLTLENGRCPMWRSDGLCRIQAELGEQALCKTCREFPRLTHDYGGFVEFGLELSCPEAARLILSEAEGETIRFDDGQPSEAGCDEEALAILLETREKALSLLNRAENPGDGLTLLLLYGYQAQEQLDGGEEEEFSPAEALKTAAALKREPDIPGFLEFFRGLEILTEEWAALLDRPCTPALPPHVKALARYLIERYWLQAVSDYDLMGRVTFILIS